MVKYRILFIVLIIIIAIGVWYYLKKQSEAPVDDTVFVPSEPVTIPEEDRTKRVRPPAIKFPVPEVSEAEPAPGTGQEAEPYLPALDESDEAMKQELEKLYGQKTVAEMFLLKSLIRHFVVTVDNMTRRKLPQRYVFTTTPADQFAVDKVADDEIYLSSENYQRYDRFIDFIENTDLDRITNLYKSYYPLFQEAYEELGYPDRYFNDRFIEVIDHLLKAPEPEGKIRLIRPKVFYQFADPDLESLSAGQKILIRIGPRNAAIVKNMLRELRQRLTSFTVN